MDEWTCRRISGTIVGGKVFLSVVSTSELLSSWQESVFLGGGNSLGGFLWQLITLGGPVFRQIKTFTENYSPYLLFSKRLQLQIINISKWHILGWHVLLSFISSVNHLHFSNNHKLSIHFIVEMTSCLYLA